MEDQAGTLLLIAFGAFIVPLLSGRIGIPAAVGEIVFGILVGPQLLEIVAETGDFFDVLAEFGFAFLMFLAGLELDFASLERRGARPVVISGSIAMLIIGLGFVASAYLMGRSPIFGVVLGAMSIGLALVSLRETGEARSEFGQTVILVGSIGEFLTIIIVTLYGVVGSVGLGLEFLTEVVSLVGVFAIAYIVLKTLRLLVWWFPAQFSRMIEVEDPSEIGVRAGLALMIAFVAIAELLEMEAILGAFLAGALFSFVFREKGILETKLAGIGYGFFIPVFFIHVGVKFDLESLGTLDIYPLLAQILVISLAIKAIASITFFAMGFSVRQIAGAALLLATPLTLLVAIAEIGLDLGALTELENATIILVAVVSGLLFPTAYKRLGKKKAVEAGPVAGD
jgi:Kef-type K+ transport system membrane component KefB